MLVTPEPYAPVLLFGAGLIGLVIGLVVYLAILALSLWIGYLIIKAAVRNGLREHTLWLECINDTNYVCGRPVGYYDLLYPWEPL